MGYFEWEGCAEGEDAVWAQGECWPVADRAVESRRDGAESSY